MITTIQSIQTRDYAQLVSLKISKNIQVND